MTTPPQPSNTFVTVIGPSFAKSLLGFFIATVFLAFSATTAFSQQNLFNIPSGILTPKGKFFYQNQTNLYPGSWNANKPGIEVKNHFVMGLPYQSEIGLNVINSGFKMNGRGIEYQDNDYKARGPLSSIVLLTGQKQVYQNLDRTFNANIGFQAGSNLFSERYNLHLAGMVYALGVWHDGPLHSIITGGVSVGNMALLGKGVVTNALVGFEVPIVKKRFYIMGDAIIGNNPVSMSVLGIMVQPGKQIQLCAGLGAPSNFGPVSNKWAWVFELNWFNF
jgi:hypothetical protein